MDIVDRPLTDEEREEMELAWAFTDDRERMIYLDACFIADVPPCEGTRAREAFDRMAAHTRATIAHRTLGVALEFDRKTRARLEQVVTKARAEIEHADEVWDRASALVDVLVGDRIG